MYTVTFFIFLFPSNIIFLKIFKLIEGCSKLACSTVGVCMCNFVRFFLNFLIFFFSKLYYKKRDYCQTLDISVCNVCICSSVVNFGHQPFEGSTVCLAPSSHVRDSQSIVPAGVSQGHVFYKG